MQPPAGKTRRHRVRSSIFVVVAACLVLVLWPVGHSGATYLGPEEIPTESPLYGSLEELATRYGTPPSFLQTRPWTRQTARRFLDSLVIGGCACTQDPAYVRVAREVSTHSEVSREPLIRVTGASDTVEVSPYVRVDYQENRARAPSIIRDYRIGAVASATRSGRFLLFTDYYMATYSPEPHGNPISGTRFAVVEGVEFNVWFDRATVTYDASSFLVRAGHTWLRWGPGQSGTLGLSDGSLALDLIETRVAFAGNAQLSWVLAWLDPLAETYLAGHRLDVRLGRSLDLGFAELARFDGASQVPLYLIPVVGYNHREKQLTHFADTSADTTGKFSKNNVLWTADAVWRAVRGVRIYGELLIDDISFSSEYRPTEIGFQLGSHLSRLVRSMGAIGARLEYTRVYDFTYSTWHEHNFESDGFPLGYPLGPDVEAILANGSWDPGSDWSFGLGVTRVRKGEGRLGIAWIPSDGKVENVPLSGVVERTVRIEATSAYQSSRNLRVDLRLGWDDVENAGHTPGLGVSAAAGSFRVGVSW
jgi:hypothetical protein